MKKFLLSIVVVLLIIFALYMTKQPSENEKGNFNIAVLKGPTGLGIVKLMEDNLYNISIVNTPEEILTKIINGEADIAAVPTNLASTIYNKTEGNISTVCVHTLGILYILDSSGTVNKLSDLSGKTIYATGQASIPEYVLNYILKENNIKNVTIEFLNEHSELAAMAASGTVNICLLPEPFVTTVLEKNKTFKIAIDLTKEWNTITALELPMGVMIVRNEIIDSNKNLLNIFLDDYKKSIEYVNTNLDSASSLAVKHEIIADLEVAKLAIPNCNITFIEGEKMRSNVSAFLQILEGYEPKSIGGKLPDENFYYTK